MRFPLSFRAARACVLATLLSSLGLAPSFAHMGGGPGLGARPSGGFGRFPHFAPHGFNQRFEGGRLGFNRFGFHRFNHQGGNQLLVGGGWGWGAWGGYSAFGASERVLVGEGAPVIINIAVDPGPGDPGALSGGCVIHKLNYDNTGKFVGERQIPRC